MKKLIISILVLIPFSIFAQLTGYWQTDIGGCYQIRQDGNEIWWIAERAPDVRASITFHGYIVDNILTGKWCDMPSHNRQNCGQVISLRIENNNRMIKVASSISYYGNVWTRQNGPCTTGGEYWEVTGAGGWTAIWTRRGNSNVYDGLWTGPQGQKGTTIIEITISGNKMTGIRTSSQDGILCNYTGQLSEDGHSVRGTGSCTTGPTWNWSAIIKK